MHTAAIQGHVEACKLLLRYGASGRARDRAGRSPAHLCVELSSSGSPAKRPNYQHILLAILTCSDQPEPDQQVGESSRSDWLTSLLHCAAEAGARAAAALLFEHGAHDGTIRHESRTALHIASAGGDTALVDLLLEAKDTQCTTQQVPPCCSHLCNRQNPQQPLLCVGHINRNSAAVAHRTSSCKPIGSVFISPNLSWAGGGQHRSPVL